MATVAAAVAIAFTKNVVNHAEGFRGGIYRGRIAGGGRGRNDLRQAAIVLEGGEGRKPSNSLSCWLVDSEIGIWCSRRRSSNRRHSRSEGTDH